MSFFKIVLSLQVLILSSFFSVQAETLAEIKGYQNAQLQVSVLNQAEINAVFDLLKSESSIPFKFPDDGCFARAHKMSMLMDDLGITSLKTFLIGDLRLKTSFHPNGFVDWWYHVAPVVLSKETNELVVLDPSVQDQALLKTQWVKMLTSHFFGSVDQSFETVRFIYGPEDAFEDPFLTSYNDYDIFDMEQALSYFSSLMNERLGTSIPLASSQTRVEKVFSRSAALKNKPLVLK